MILSQEIIKILKRVICILLLLATRAMAAQDCVPFKVYKSAKLPDPPIFSTPQPLPSEWEENLLNGISLSKDNHGFAEIYRTWSRSHVLVAENRYRILKCISYYVNLKGWTAIVDGKLSQTLYPVNPIIISGTVIPDYLRFDDTRPEAQELQKELFQRFGVVAIDHTDEHSAAVLKELLVLLKNIFPRGLNGVRSFKYFYAFSGHDSEIDIAAYHRQMNAISIGGVKSYQDAVLTPEQRIKVDSALLHELGHAFVFDQLGAQTLAYISNTFSRWPKISPSTLYAPVLFEAYPVTKLKNIVSEYSTSNIHEWFADSFAATFMIELGKKNVFGPAWVKYMSDFNSHYWYNYNNISQGFRKFIIRKISIPH